MPKIEIIRRNAKRPVKIAARIAHKLVQSGGFSYVNEDDKVSSPKRAAKKDHAARRHEAKPVILNKTTGEPVQKESTQAGPQAVSRVGVPIAGDMQPMTSAIKPMSSARLVVKPTKQRTLTREQLEEMTKADLKVLGQKIGLDLKPAEPKDEWVRKLTRYMRRDMRAER